MSILARLRGGVSAGYKRRGAYIRSLDRLNRLPRHAAYLARWPGVPDHPTREALWDAAAALCDTPTDYLEFGVHEGHSILHWARARPEPGHRFTGFDTFTGLPETWNPAFPQGTFDTGGRVPETSDARVRFVVGLFQDTLPAFLSRFEPDPGRRLVVHIDCDLYSSALFCLAKLDWLLVPGSLLLFDEFGDVLHEFRAFEDYCASHRREATPLGFHDEGYTAALIMR